MLFRPFHGFRYDDPDAGPEIALGVMDLSSVVSGDSGYSAMRLARSPELFGEWVARGVLRRDAQPALYAYRSGIRDESGFRQSCGVIGLASDPHSVESEVALVAVDAPALGDLISASTGQLLARATDDSGVHHRLWAIEQTTVIETIAEIAAGAEAPSNALVAISPEGSPPPPGFVFAAH